MEVPPRPRGWVTTWLAPIAFGLALYAPPFIAPADAAELDQLLERLSSGGFVLRFAGTDRVRPAEPQARRTTPAVAGPAPAGADATIGPNVRLGDDPAALPATQRSQAEPHLARSVADTNLVVATFQEGRFTDGGAVDCGYAVSRDGGQSWARRLIPHLIVSVDGGAFDRASDPVAGVDLEGTIYLNTLAIRETTSGFLTTVVLSNSKDGGETFSIPRTVVTSSTTAVFPDKNWMTVNTFPGTPSVGRVVVTYTSFETTGAQQITPVKATVSDDGGVTWTIPRTLSPPDCQGSQPMFLPDGSLAVVYWNFNGPSGQRLELAHSPDGGITFSTPRPIAEVRLHDDPVARDGSFLPSAVADRVHGTIYVAYQALELPSRPRVLFTRSRNRGVTWTTPLPVNDTPGNRSVFNPAVAVSPDGQQVSILYCDKRHDDGTGRWVDLYLAESFDGGATWEPSLRVSEVSSDLNLAPLTASGRMLGDYQGLVPALNLEAPGFGIWVDTRTGNPDPFVAAIPRTRGSTFETWRRLAFDAAELADPRQSGPSADADGDGLPNLIEYALSSSPRVADRNPFRSQVGTLLEISFEPSSVATDIEWLWRDSGDLTTWSAVEPLAVEPGVAADPTRRQWRVGFGAEGSQRFIVLGARQVGAP